VAVRGGECPKTRNFVDKKKKIRGSGEKKWQSEGETGGEKKKHDIAERFLGWKKGPEKRTSMNRRSLPSTIKPHRGNVRAPDKKGKKGDYDPVSPMTGVKVAEVDSLIKKPLF